MAPATAELERIAAEIRAIHQRLVHLHLNPITELETIMAALDVLKALAPRIDTVTAGLGTDVSTAVANAVAPLNAEIATLQAAATQTESDTQAVADTLTTSVGALETAAGVTAPAAPAEPAAS